MSTPCDQTQHLDEQVVADYLKRHPDFFTRHGALLAELELSHETGPATSLIERQVSVLRHHNRQYRERLQELVRIAHDNDHLIERLQQLTLALLDTSELARLAELLEQSLAADFNADTSALHLLDAPQALAVEEAMRGFVHIHHEDSAIPAEARKIVARRKPACGRFEQETLDFLFGTEAETITSAALLPLDMGNGEAAGLLAIGSRDPRRFHAEMGTAYLRHMGELIGRRLRPHLARA